MSKKTLYIAMVFSIWYGCAQQSSPSGGKKDTIPPSIKASSPENFTKNFNENSIELTFDEFVQINNITSQIIITPSIKTTPKFKLKGKKLSIEIEDTLEANTTYVFNFGEGIQDITENNPLDSNLFVFSTGDEIDSLQISGQVKDAFTLQPQEKMLIALYSSLDDSIAFKEKPNYLSKSDASGHFSLGYLKEGEYQLLAFEDLNLNYLFDPESEKVAFLDSIINPLDSAYYELTTFKEDIPNQYIVSSSCNEYGKIQFIFNEPTQNAVAELMNRSFKKPWYIKEVGINKDTITYWTTEALDTMKFQVSDNGAILDTVELLMAEKLKQKEMEEERLSVTSNVSKSRTLDLFNDLSVQFNHPIKDYEAEGIFLIENESDTLPVNLTLSDQALRTFLIHHSWKEAAKYQLYIPPRKFYDIFDIFNDTVRFNFETPSWSKYADINLSYDIKGQVSQYLIQLIKSGKILQTDTIVKKGQLAYPHLSAGNYSLKLMYDNNANGEWDTGNLMKKKQPEKVIFYSDEIDVRAGWDLDLEWNVDE